MIQRNNVEGIDSEIMMRSNFEDIIEQFRIFHLSVIILKFFTFNKCCQLHSLIVTTSVTTY